MTRNSCMAAALAAAVLTAPHGVAAGLGEEADLNAGLQVVAAADMIRKRCPEIEPRMVRALSYMRGLAREARERGYSDDAIRAYVEDDAAKDRVEARARAYLARRGLGAGGAEDHCRVGRLEIAEGTPIGALLRGR